MPLPALSLRGGKQRPVPRFTALPSRGHVGPPVGPRGAGPAFPTCLAPPRPWTPKVRALLPGASPGPPSPGLPVPLKPEKRRLEPSLLP